MSNDVRTIASDSAQGMRNMFLDMNNASREVNAIAKVAIPAMHARRVRHLWYRRTMSASVVGVCAVLSWADPKVALPLGVLALIVLVVHGLTVERS